MTNGPIQFRRFSKAFDAVQRVSISRGIQDALNNPDGRSEAQILEMAGAAHHCTITPIESVTPIGTFRGLDIKPD